MQSLELVGEISYQKSGTYLRPEMERGAEKGVVDWGIIWNQIQSQNLHLGWEI